MINQLKQLGKNRILIFVNSFFVLLAVVFFLASSHTASQLQSQQAAERWKGENELAFSQVSCFIPTSKNLTVNNINTFRSALVTKLTEAALDNPSELFVDCWSCQGSVKVASDRVNGTASVIAVGGDYFTFHPLKLLSGSYISEGDLMKDAVILDRELAWVLFGGTDLAGLSMKVAGQTVTIAGVVDREDDSASQKAYTAGMGLYISYDLYADLVKAQTDDGSGSAVTSYVTGSGSAITCYEVVLPNPVKNFAINAVQDKFPIGSGIIIENTGRFTFSKLMKAVFTPGQRAMQNGVPYPYWENAALLTESRAGFLLLLGILCALTPELTFAVYFIRNLRWSHRKVTNDYLPNLEEKTEEAIRVRQRARWEKKHPGQT